MNDRLTSFAAVEFAMRLDCLDAEIKIAEERAKIVKSERSCLIYQGLTVMYTHRVHPTTVPTKVVDELALATDYLEA